MIVLRVARSGRRVPRNAVTTLAVEEPCNLVHEYILPGEPEPDAGHASGSGDRLLDKPERWSRVSYKPQYCDS